MLVGPQWGKIGHFRPQGRTKSGQDFHGSIWPPFLLCRCLLSGPQNLVVLEHRAALMLSRWVDVALHQTNRTMPKDCRQRGEIDARLRETGCGSVAEIVQDERECDSGLRSCCADSVVRPI